MNIAAGSLSRKVLFEHPVGTVDELNQPVRVWLPLLYRWGRPLGSTGMAAVRALMEGVPLVPGQYSWRFRFLLSGVTTDMRINYKGQIFDIREIRHDFDRRSYTDYVCELGGNNG